MLTLTSLTIWLCWEHAGSGGSGFTGTGVTGFTGSNTPGLTQSMLVAVDMTSLVPEILDSGFAS